MYIFVISQVLSRFRSYKLRFECIGTSFRSSELLVNTVLLASRSTFISLKSIVRVKMVITCPQKVYPNIAKKLFH
eukprot:UN20980